jgi:arylsulfatase A-like enzyme
MVKKIGLGAAGGVIAGALVGLGEAMYILGGASTGEYGALLYATVLYGVLGTCGGLGIGAGLWFLSLLKLKLDEDRIYALGFLGIFCGLGLVITRYVANKSIYMEQGVPMKGMLVILAIYGALGLLGLWLGRIMLTQTPFKILQTLRGTLAAYGGLILLTAVFSFSPEDSSRAGKMAPEREQSAELAERGNMLLIMVDTLRADHLGTYGFSTDISPHIDDLAADGVVFEKAYASASWTRASTASLFTSMSPSGHSCDVKVAMLPDEVTTIAEVLQEQGYVTAGLPNNINVTRSFNFQQGFDWFEYQAPEYIAGATESSSQLSMYNVVRKVRDRLTDGKKRVEDYYQPADVVLDNAGEFMTANKDRRWFSFVHLMEPHDPYFERPFTGEGVGRAEMEFPPPELEGAIRKAYQQEITWMDTELGKFFDWMKAEGLYDNTTIILTSDHGEEFLEHGGWWHGTTLYDEQLHVPMIVKRPGSEWAGTRVPWQVRQMDAPATMAVLGGAVIPMEWQGDDLFEEDFAGTLPTLDGSAQVAEADAEPVEGDDDAVAAVDAAPPAPTKAELIDHRERIVLSEENFEGNVLSSVRADGFKYIRANEGNRRGLQTEEMYNVDADPGEQDNVAGKNGKVQSELSGLLKSQLEAAMAVKVEAQTAEITADDCERMRALGYIEGDCNELTGGGPVSTGASPDGN